MLRIPAFRDFFLATFVSNCGRWLQFAALGILGWELTESNAYLGYLIFAQLAPLGVLSLVGGSLADTADRRRLLLGTQTWQMVWTFVLAAALLSGTINQWLLLVLVFIIGIGQGLYAPVFASVLPLIAGEQNLRAAVSLNSVQINGARVVGPALGGILASRMSFSGLFAINAASYLFVIAAIWRFTLPAPIAQASRSVSDRLFGGFRIVRKAPQVGRPIVIMAIYAFFCLPFIGQLPAIAETNLGIDVKAPEYAWFYACFGLGALLGAVLVSTVLLSLPHSIIVRTTLVGFAASLAWLSTVRSITVAYVAIFLVALFYFTLPTVLATSWQEHVDNSIRGRVAALWVLAFGGMVPIANLVGGQFVEATSLAALMTIGVAVALLLAVSARLQPGPIVDDSLLVEPANQHRG